MGGLEPVPDDHPGWDSSGGLLDAEGLPEAPRRPGDADRTIPADAILIPPGLDDIEGEPGP